MARWTDKFYLSVVPLAVFSLTVHCAAVKGLLQTRSAPMIDIREDDLKEQRMLRKEQAANLKKLQMNILESVERNNPYNDRDLYDPLDR